MSDAPRGVLASYRWAASVQKPSRNVPWYMREVNRRFGRLLAVLAMKAGMRPDLVTLASFVAFLGGMAVLLGTGGGLLAACLCLLLLQLGFALDAADGQLARLTGTASPAGEWLDHVVDAARHLLFHLLIAVGWVAGDRGPATYALLPLAFAIIVQVRFFAQILAEKLAAANPATSAGGRGEGNSSWLQFPADTGVINFVVLLWPWPRLFLLGYALLGAAHGLLALATFCRRYRELR